MQRVCHNLLLQYGSIFLCFYAFLCFPAEAVLSSFFFFLFFFCFALLTPVPVSLNEIPAVLLDTHFTLSVQFGLL